MPRTCKFQDMRLNERQFSKWIARAGTSLNEANCRVCQKSFDVSNMDEAALRNHMRSKWHTCCPRLSNKPQFYYFFRMLIGRYRYLEYMRYTSEVKLP